MTKTTHVTKLFLNYFILINNKLRVAWRECSESLITSLLLALYVQLEKQLLEEYREVLKQEEILWYQEKYICTVLFKSLRSYLGLLRRRLRVKGKEKSLMKILSLEWKLKSDLDHESSTCILQFDQVIGSKDWDHLDMINYILYN